METAIRVVRQHRTTVPVPEDQRDAERQLPATPNTEISDSKMFSARWENCAGPVSHLARKLLEEDVQFGQTHSAPESLRVPEELAIVSDSKPSPPPGWVQGGGGSLQLGAQSAQERESVRDHEELESRLELEALPTPRLGARGGGSVVRSSKRPRTRKSPNPRRA